MADDKSLSLFQAFTVPDSYRVFVAEEISNGVVHARDLHEDGKTEYHPVSVSDAIDGREESGVVLRIHTKFIFPLSIVRPLGKSYDP